MCHLRLTALAAAVAMVIATLGVARPVAADALYPGDGGGVWGFSDACDDAAWSRTYQLWYILNDAMDYVFDIPDPDFAPGDSVQLELDATVVGVLNGSVTLTGADTVSDTIPVSNPHPGDSMWQDRFGAPAEFTLAFTPGTPTTGELPVPGGFAAEYTGLAAVHATITIEGGAQQTIVMLAQGFKACETPEPTPEPTPATPSPTGGSSLPGHIAFCTQIDGRRENGTSISDAPDNALYTVNPDGSALAVLRRGCWGVVRWNANGGNLLFQDYVPGFGLATFVWGTGGAAQRVPDSAGLMQLARPDLSPDGTHMVVEGYESPSPDVELFIINVATGTWQRQGAEPLPGYPAWSASGAIAYVAASGHRVYTTDPTGTTQRELIASPGTSEGWYWNLDWSPDGTELAFAAAGDGPAGWPVSGAPTFCDRIGVVQQDGSGLTWLTPRDQCDFQPRWSPDGRSLGFIHIGDDALGHLWLMERDGSNRREVRGFNFGGTNVWYGSAMWDWGGPTTTTLPVPNTAMATNAGAAAFIALATSLLMLGVVNRRALRRRR